MGKKITKGVDLLLGFMGLAGVIVMFANVIGRYVFKAPINWSDEFLRTLFIWCYFLGGAMLYNAGGIMRLELLDDKLQKLGKHGLRMGITIFSELATAVFFGVLTYQVYKTILTYIEKGTTSSTSNTPAWVLAGGLLIGFGLIAVFAVRNIIRHFAKKDWLPEKEEQA